MKFGIGDKVKIVGYGNLVWSYPNIAKDTAPEMVGQIGMIDGFISSKDFIEYSLIGVNGKMAWYNEDQLEMITENPNKKEFYEILSSK